MSPCESTVVQSQPHRIERGVAQVSDLPDLRNPALVSGQPTQDALHLATAPRVDADTVVAYDARLLAAARSMGLSVQSPS